MSKHQCGESLVIENEHEYHEKKDRLIDTLLIITGFVFASSVSFMSATYLVLVLVFLASCVLLKSSQLIEIMAESDRRAMSYILYAAVSFLFPLVLISVYFQKNSATEDLSYIWYFSSLLSTGLFLSLMSNPTKSYDANLNDLIKVSRILSLPSDIFMFFIILSIVLVIVIVSLITLPPLAIIVLSLFFLVIGIVLLCLYKWIISGYLASRKENIKKSQKIAELRATLTGNKTLMLILVSCLVYSIFMWWYLVLDAIFPEISMISNTEYVIQSVNFSLGNHSYRLENISLMLK